MYEYKEEFLDKYLLVVHTNPTGLANMPVVNSLCSNNFGRKILLSTENNLKSGRLSCIALQKNFIL